MNLRQDTAKHIRNIRKILHQGRSEPQDDMASEINWMHQQDADYNKYLAFWLGLVFLLCAFSSCEAPAHAYSEQDAIRTIVGEASNQGYVGMVAVAEIVRHKGSLRGFYGLHASHSAHEPKWVWNMAKKAWMASKTSQLTKGADHFENTHAFGCPYWVKNCVKTFTWKDHIFYREVNRA